MTHEWITCTIINIQWYNFHQEDMKQQDHALARRFLSIADDIRSLKLERSTSEHRDALEVIEGSMVEGVLISW